MPRTTSRRLRAVRGRRLRAIVVIAALLVALVCSGLWLRTSSLVSVRGVTVTGIEGGQAAEIRDALTVSGLDMTTLAVDADALRQAVARYPIVRGLRTSTDFPHDLTIAVDAHEPVAALQAGASVTAAAADGTLLRGAATSGLPVVGVGSPPAGPRLGEARTLRALGLLGAAPTPLRRRVTRVYRDERGLSATVDQGPKLYFGGGQRWAAKWAAAAQVLASSTSQGATYVDVRVPERPVAGGFRPRSADPQPQL